MKKYLFLVFIFACSSKHTSNNDTIKCEDTLGVNATWSYVDTDEECTSLVDKFNETLTTFDPSESDCPSFIVDKDTCSALFEGTCQDVYINMDCSVENKIANCDVYLETEETSCNVGLEIK